MAHSYPADRATPRPHKVGTDDLFNGVFSALDQDVGAERPNQGQRGVIVEEADTIDQAHCRYERGAVRLPVDRPSGTFETPRRGVGVETDNEDIGKRLRTRQQVDVAAMQDVEDTVRERDPQALPPPAAAQAEKLTATHNSCVDRVRFAPDDTHVTCLSSGSGISVRASRMASTVVCAVPTSLITSPAATFAV